MSKWHGVQAPLPRMAAYESTHHLSPGVPSAAVSRPVMFHAPPTIHSPQLHARLVPHPPLQPPLMDSVGSVSPIGQGPLTPPQRPPRGRPNAASSRRSRNVSTPGAALRLSPGDGRNSRSLSAGKAGQVRHDQLNKMTNDKAVEGNVCCVRHEYCLCQPQLAVSVKT
jgi:hypothetical protein